MEWVGKRQALAEWALNVLYRGLVSICMAVIKFRSNPCCKVSNAWLQELLDAKCLTCSRWPLYSQRSGGKKQNFSVASFEGCPRYAFMIVAI